MDILMNNKIKPSQNNIPTSEESLANETNTVSKPCTLNKLRQYQERLKTARTQGIIPLILCLITLGNSQTKHEKMTAKNYGKKVRKKKFTTIPTDKDSKKNTSCALDNRNEELPLLKKTQTKQKIKKNAETSSTKE
jgi:hypothetical protein